MIYITGDKHGDFKMLEQFCKDKNTSTNDVLIILGDAGINFYCNIRDVLKKEFLSTLPITLLCIRGNHDKRTENISTYKSKEFAGGIVDYEEQYPNVLFALDGEVYNIEEKSFLVAGGAFSVDRYYRLFAYLYHNSFNSGEFEKMLDVRRMMYNEDISDDNIKYLDSLVEKYKESIHSWLDEEMSDEEKHKVACAFEKRKIDYVLTHTCPKTLTPQECLLSGLNPSLVSHKTEEFLQEIYDKHKKDIKGWFCGHFHTNKKKGKVTFLFNKIVEIDK